MTESGVQKVIAKNNTFKNPILLNNLFLFRWESDIVHIDVYSGWVKEIEVKVSKWDYLADKKKVEKHQELSRGEIHGSMGVTTPNQFYYCVLEAFVDQIELPKYAGLYVIEKNQYGEVRAKCRKKAPFIHNQKVMNEKRWKLLCEKMYYRKNI